MRTRIKLRSHVPHGVPVSGRIDNVGGRGSDMYSSWPSHPAYVHASGSGGDSRLSGDGISDGDIRGDSGIIVAAAGDGGDAGRNSISISDASTGHITVSASQKDYYLTVTGANSYDSAGNGLVAGDTDYNSISNSDDQPRSTENFNGFILNQSNSDGIRNSTSGSGVSSIGSSGSQDGDSTHWTLSGILSSVDNGASSTFRGSNSGIESGSSHVSSDSIGTLGGHLGLDRIVNDYNYPSGSGGVFDYGSNEHNILFDDGLDYLRGNISLTAQQDSFSQELFNRIEFKMGDDMTLYVTPAIIVLGNISNFVAFLVLRRKKFKNSSVVFYMRAYALANLCFLNLMLGVAWFCIVLNIPYLAHRADWSCRLWTFISNAITYSGIWFVVVMGIDRFVYTNLPSKSPGYCSVFTAKGITTFVIICLVVVSIHAMWTFELQPQGCWVSYQDDLHTLTWPWWSAALYSYIPQLLLLLQIIGQSVCFCVRVWLKQPHSPLNNRQSEDQDTFVIPVFVITVSFFFFTIPAIAINLLDIHLPSNLLRVDVIAKIELAKKITELLSSFNNSLLGIVLVVLSPTYRSELLGLSRAIFCCARSRTLKVFEMRTISHSDDSSPHVQVDYELCNNNEENLATDV